MKKLMAITLAAVMLLPMAACKEKIEAGDANRYKNYAKMTPEQIVAQMTLEQKAAQMVQPAVYRITNDDMRLNGYGSVLSTSGHTNAEQWRKTVDGLQQAAIESPSGIPFIYGQDDVHGVNYCVNAVYFPHNIGIGAANDEELTYKMGQITADEAKICHMMWNFSPVVAQSADPRWGRTYESYGSDLETIKKLSTAYTKGLIDKGLVACAKHFFADGNVVYGTGEQSETPMLIDRGDAKLTDAEIAELLKVYQAQIDAGVQTIMISHSSLNGVKMHENKEYIMKLKNEMGFKGFIVSDWGSVGNITGETYKDKVIKSVNCGIDMLMETDRFEECKQIIIDGVNNKEIPEERVNDAVTRIIKVKKDAGLFDDPMFTNMKTDKTETGSLEYRKVAEQLVEKSLVLVKNDKNTLPLKQGTKVYITGPAADDGAVQCGGWTLDWNSATISDIQGVTTIKEAFERYAKEYGIEVITDPDKASKADVVLLCVGEQAYAEWNGDTEDLKLNGKLGLAGNRDAMDEAKKLGKPTVTCIVAGRHVIIDESDYKNWDSVVMCYLPGSEGKGISDVLCGCANFSGKLPSNWYGSLDQIGTDNCFLKKGYGLTYGDGFTARTEPETVLDAPAKAAANPADGTSYKKGLYKDRIYVNDCSGLKAKIEGDLQQVSENELREGRAYTLSKCTTAKDKVRENATFYDASFGSEVLGIDLKFVNTKLASPDDPGYDENKYLDDYGKFFKEMLKDYPITIEYKGRTKATLSGKEYVRDTYTLSGNEGVQTVCIYARKLDDNLMSTVEIYWFGKHTAEEYEKNFG